MKLVVVLLSVAVVVNCSPVPQEESVFKLAIGSFVNCMNSDLNLCLKEHALRAAERLRAVRSLKITEGITIHNNGPQEARSLEPLSEDSQIRNKQVTERLWEKVTDLLQNGELELSYGGDDEEPRSLEEGRRRGGGGGGGHSDFGDFGSSHGGGGGKGGKKKIKMWAPLYRLATLKAKAATVFFLGIIAVALWKLAVIAKIAFIAKIIAVAKGLLAKKQGHQEHGWAPAEEHGHGWESQGGWGRSGNKANDLAYAAYKQQ